MANYSNYSSSSFYVVLPSNTNVEGNRTNSFRVRLPQKLQFGSEWHVGLAVMVYPHSWPSLGTVDAQYVDVVWQTGKNFRIPVESSSLKNPTELSANLRTALESGNEELAQQVRTVQFDYGKMVGEIREKAKKEYEQIVAEQREWENLKNVERQAAVVDHITAAGDIEGAEHIIAERQISHPLMLKSEEDVYLDLLNAEIAKMDDETRAILDATKETGLEAWVHAYRHPVMACRFSFDEVKNRFSVFIAKKFVKEIVLTEQLAYILGFETPVLRESTTGKFMPDMKGGVSSFHVYAPGLIVPMMIGDVTAPVLRIVTIRGKQDEVIEEQFFSIQYHKVLVKEISEIFIEIRTASGALMPFQYGTCTLTLHFRKASYF